MVKEDLRKTNPNVVSNQYVPEPVKFKPPTHDEIHSCISAWDGDITEQQARYLLEINFFREEVDRLQATLNLQLANAIMRRKEIAFEVSEKVKLQAENKELKKKNTELALAEDEAAFQLGTLKDTLKSYQETAKGHTEFYKTITNKFDQLQAKLSVTQLELGAADKEIERLKQFERFYRHIETHLGPDDVVICKICGKSLNEIEQALKGGD